MYCNLLFFNALMPLYWICFLPCESHGRIDNKVNFDYLYENVTFVPVNAWKMFFFLCAFGFFLPWKHPPATFKEQQQIIVMSWFFIIFIHVFIFCGLIPSGLQGELETILVVIKRDGVTPLKSYTGLHMRISQRFWGQRFLFPKILITKQCIRYIF